MEGVFQKKESGMSNWLTPEEKRAFDEDGYLIIENALIPEQVKVLSKALDKVRKGREGRPLNYCDIFREDKVFLELIDIDTVFPKIWAMMGANIWVNHAHYVIVPPESKTEKIYYGWHRDGGVMRQNMGIQLPMMFLKAAFYLNDLHEPYSGQTYIIPGSHRTNQFENNYDKFSIPRDAVPINVSAGMAVIFHPNLVHSLHSPNYSINTREAIFIQWAFRWLFPASSMNNEHLKEIIKDPIRRQLLGFTTVECHMRDADKLPYATQMRSGRYQPRSEDIPLKEYIEKSGYSLEEEIFNY